MYYLYVLKCADDSLYIGISTDLERRVYEHNNSAKAAKYTRARRPLLLLYSEEYVDRSTATRAEKEWKSLTRAEKLVKLREKGVLI